MTATLIPRLPMHKPGNVATCNIEKIPDDYLTTIVAYRISDLWNVHYIYSYCTWWWFHGSALLYCIMHCLIILSFPLSLSHAVGVSTNSSPVSEEQ